jgi:hypothetical protein
MADYPKPACGAAHEMMQANQAADAPAALPAARASAIALHGTSGYAQRTSLAFKRSLGANQSRYGSSGTYVPVMRRAHSGMRPIDARMPTHRS